MHNNFCNRPATAGLGGISLLPPQATATAAYNPTLLQAGYVSMPRADDGSGAVFQTPNGAGLCAGGQFTADETGGPATVTTSTSGFIEFVNPNGQIGSVDGTTRSIVSAGNIFSNLICFPKSG